MASDPSNGADRIAHAIDRRSFLAAAGTGSVAAVAGCADEGAIDDEGTPGETTEDDGDDGEDVLQIVAPPTDSFDNIRTKGDGSETVTYQIYAGLMTYDPEAVEPIGEAVEDFRISEDGLRYEFDLSEDAVFHDGTEFTAGDMIYSWERLVASENTQESRHITTDIPIDHEVTVDSILDATYPADYVEGSLAVEAVDEKTFAFELRRPWHSVLANLTIGEVEPIPEGLVDDVPGYDGELTFEEFESGNPIGLGPFEFSEFDQGSRVRMDAFDDYFGEGPNIDAIEMTILDDADARYQRALGGESHVFKVPEAQFDQTAVDIENELETGLRLGRYTLENGEEVNYGEWQVARTEYIINNNERVPKFVRQAIAFTVNQHELVEDVYNGRGVPAYMVTPPTVFPGGPQAYMEKAENEYPYGFNERLPDEARQLMEDNGHDQDDPYELTFTTFDDREPGIHQDLAETLQEQLSPVHIDVTIEQVPFSTIIDRAISGELDSFTLGNSLDYPEPDDTLQYAWGNPDDFSRWSGTDASQRATDAWERAQDFSGPSDDDQAERYDAYLEMEEAYWEDAVDIQLRHPINYQMWTDDIEYQAQASSFHRKQYNRLTFQ